MSEKVVFVTGHKSPDTDSICSAISYANLKNQMGVAAKPICAGKANKETQFALEYFKVDHPEIVTSFAVRIKDVVEAIPALGPDASLDDVLEWRDAYDINRIPVVEGDKFLGLILPKKLIVALGEALHGKKGITAKDLVSKASCQIVDPELKLRDFDRGHAGAYPVVAGDKYYGMVRASVEAPKDKQEVILVDHNEKVQIIDDIEDAKIIENIDHHRIGGLVTDSPIFIHYEPVGCTCTIVANMYWQYGQEIPKHIAGLLMSAIISDTLLFRSPTCTEKDVVTVKKLAEIAGVDYETYGMEMLKAGANVSDFTVEQIVRNDCKEFTADGKVFTIAQISVMDTAEVLDKKGKLLEALDSLRSEKGYFASYVMVTNILDESTTMLYSGEVAPIVEKAFSAKVEDQSVFLPNTMSRKKQIVPPLLEAMK